MGTLVKHKASIFLSFLTPESLGFKVLGSSQATQNIHNGQEIIKLYFWGKFIFLKYRVTSALWLSHNTKTKGLAI